MPRELNDWELNKLRSESKYIDEIKRQKALEELKHTREILNQAKEKAS